MKKIISLEVSEELNELLRIEAFNQNKTKSAVIRDILDKALKEYGSGKEEDK